MFKKMFKEPNHRVMEAHTNDCEETSDSLMISDPHAFDCCICFASLTIPVFECDNGHVVCSTCCSKHGNRCQKCYTGITLKRSRAIENLLQSIKISCLNVKHGCKERITYSGKRKHEEECIYVPCYCPILGCDFAASSKVLSNHFSHMHKDSRIQFSYGSPFFVTLKFNNKAIILQENSVGKLFILNNRTESVGNAVNISCIGPPNSSEPRYYYDILARSQKSSAKFHSFSKNVQRVSLETLSSEFLLIQFGFSEPLKLEICITPKMQIFVQTLTEKIIPLKVESSDTVASMKAKICDKEWFILHQHYLFLANKQLDDRQTIDDYDIQDKSILYLVGDLHHEDNHSPCS